MTTSQITSLSKPHGSEPIFSGTLGYFRTRNKRRLYSLIIDEFEKSGLSQADLARRLGKTPDVVCRWLRRPTNWTIDTISDLLFAMTGAEVAYGVNYPVEQPAQDDVRPLDVERPSSGTSNTKAELHLEAA